MFAHKPHLFTLMTLAFFSLSLGACGYKNPDPEVGTPVTEKSHAIGPFQITFNANGDYEATFDAPISQSAGKVEYYLDAGVANRFRVLSSSPTVFGCDGKQPNYSIFWLGDAAQSSGQYVMTGSSITTYPGKRGLLMLVFDNLAPCNRLVFTLKLKKDEALAVGSLPATLQN